MLTDEEVEVIVICPPERRKQVKRLQHYRPAWESDRLFADWLRPDEDDDLKAKCRICPNSSLRAEKTVLMLHARSKKHERNMQMVAKLTNMCRTCLSEDEGAVSIFARNEEFHMTYGQMLEVVCRVQAHEGDGRPQHLCASCRPRLAAAYAYVTLARRADGRLSARRAALPELAPFLKLRAGTNVIDSTAPYTTEYLEEDGDITDGPTAQAPCHLCSHCGVTRGSVVDLQVHMCKCPGNPNNAAMKTTCFVCEESFKTNHKLLRHVRETHDSKNISQTTGSRATGLQPCNIPVLGEPLSECDSEVEEEAPPRCGVCSRMFRAREQLDLHFGEHGSETVGRRATGLQPCNIPVLGEPLSECDSEVEEEAPPRCGVCSRMFRAREQLDLHFGEHGSETVGRRATGLQPCNIPVLGEPLSECDSEVEEEAPPRCGVCSRMFRAREQLDLHFGEHGSETVGRRATGLQPCNIPVLGEPLSECDSEVEEEAPPRCGVCSRMFRAREQLDLHFGEHGSETVGRRATGLQPCNIPVLGEPLSECDSEVEEEAPPRCGVCSRMFRAREQLDLHFGEHGGETVGRRATGLQPCNIPVLGEPLSECDSEVEEEAPPRCGVCSRMFRAREQLDLHFGEHGGETVGRRATGLQPCNIPVLGEPLSECDSEVEEEAPPRCGVCSRMIRAREQLDLHFGEHGGETVGRRATGLQPCNIPVLGEPLSECDSEVEEEAPPRCGVCSRMFRAREQLDLHFGEHGGTKAIVCTLCERIYLKLPPFKKHFAEHHPDIEKEQKETGIDTSAIDTAAYQKTTRLRDLLAVNTVSKEPNEEVEVFAQLCALCGRLLLSPESLREHYDADHPDMAHRCDLCAKKFGDPTAALRHRRLCARVERRHACEQCGERYEREGLLTRHVRGEHGGADGGYLAARVCGECGGQFAKKSQLEKHKLTHLPAYECSVCQKKFKNENVFKRHFEKHDKERRKKHLCTFCGKNFRLAESLKVHVRRHTGEKPFICSYCGHGFPRNEQLKWHVRIHTGERPFTCKLCPKAFRRHMCLARHMRVHTGERPYSCAHCDRTFTQSNDLARHQRHHTGEKPHKCDVCGEKFYQKKDLNKHMTLLNHHESDGRAEDASAGFAEECAVSMVLDENGLIIIEGMEDVKDAS